MCAAVIGRDREQTTKKDRQKAILPRHKEITKLLPV